ncbi:truncayed alpha-ketoglutarate transport protein [Escherichia coli]|nr:truncayed alpha-ketoglutarate transport protein [Escherichia coli]
MAESTVTADSKLTSSDTRRRIWAIVGASSGNLVEWFRFLCLLVLFTLLCPHLLPFREHDDSTTTNSRCFLLRDS